MADYSGDRVHVGPHAAGTCGTCDRERMTGRCEDRDYDGTRCGDVTDHPGEHSWHESVERVWVEVERLQTEVQGLRTLSRADRDNLADCRKRSTNQANRIAELDDEVERLRARYESKDRTWRKAEDEVERLRVENASLVDRHNRESHGTASHEAMAYEDLKRENERLQEAYDAAYGENGALAAWKAEVEGLQEENRQLRDRLDFQTEYRNEVERLQGVVEDAESRAWYAATRLRRFEAQGCTCGERGACAYCRSRSVGGQETPADAPDIPTVRAPAGPPKRSRDPGTHTREECR